MAQSDPNTCPHCGSPSTAVTFGFNPQRMNNDETIIHDCLFACADCDGQWAAMGFVMIARRDGGQPSMQAQEALAKAVAAAEELRIEPLDQEGNPI